MAIEPITPLHHDFQPAAEADEALVAEIAAQLAALEGEDA